MQRTSSLHSPLNRPLGLQRLCPFGPQTRARDRPRDDADGVGGAGGRQALRDLARSRIVADDLLDESLIGPEPRDGVYADLAKVTFDRQYTMTDEDV